MADSGSGDDELERSGGDGFIRETTGEEIDQDALHESQEQISFDGAFHSQFQSQNQDLMGNTLHAQADMSQLLTQQATLQALAQQQALAQAALAQQTNQSATGPGSSGGNAA